MKRLPIVLSLVALILLAASIAYWVMQLYHPPQRPQEAAPQASVPEPSAEAAATLFGGQPSAAVVSNYQLTGVVAAGDDSVAIIVADGQPPVALKVGKELVPGITVSQVHPRYVMLSDGGVMKRIDLATDTKPAVPLNGGAPGMAAPPGQPPGMEAQSAPGVVQAQGPQEASHPQSRPSDSSRPGEGGCAYLNAQGCTQRGREEAPSAAPPPPAPVQMPPPTRSPRAP